MLFILAAASSLSAEPSLLPPRDVKQQVLVQGVRHEVHIKVDGKAVSKRLGSSTVGLNIDDYVRPKIALEEVAQNEFDGKCFIVDFIRLSHRTEAYVRCVP